MTKQNDAIEEFDDTLDDAQEREIFSRPDTAQKWLTQRANSVFGDKREAERWMESEIKALGGKTPRQAMDTSEGAKEVRRILGRIEHGVLS